MTKKGTATALAFGFLAFTLSVLPVAAEYCGLPRYSCESKGLPYDEKTRCCLSATPEDRPVKNIGKATTQAACEAQGKRWDQQEGRCVRVGPPTGALKAALEADCARKGLPYDE